MIARGSDPEQVAYGGKILGESAIKLEEQIGSKVIYNYDVSDYLSALYAYVIIADSAIYKPVIII